MELELHGKVAIVTGGKQGIGRAISVGLAAEGTKIAICDIEEEGAEVVVDEVRNLGVECMFTKVDVADFDKVQSMVSKVLEKFGKIDILVNNAGTLEVIPFHRSTPENWNRDINVGLLGAMNCCRAVIEQMRQQKSGRIVNISSLAARQTSPQSTAYTAAKAGMVGLTLSLAIEYGRYGIATNCVGPGFVLTELVKFQIRRDEDLEKDLTPDARKERKHWLTSRYPMGKWCEPEDVANVVILLSSPRAMKWVNGEFIVIDGGSSKVA